VAANSNNKKKRPGQSGRVTPKGTVPASARRKVDPEEIRPLPQIGRRPPNPVFVLVVAAVWLGCGAFALVGLRASWRLIPGIVFIGIGVLFARGGIVALARRDR
jgi:hypothetical protein